MALNFTTKINCNLQNLYKSFGIQSSLLKTSIPASLATQRKPQVAAPRCYSQQGEGSKCKKFTKCPKFNLKGCQPQGRKQCRLVPYPFKKCCKIVAPYPSYSETCHEDLPENPSECMQCPYRMKPIDFDSYRNKGFHTSTAQAGRRRDRTPNKTDTDNLELLQELINTESCVGMKCDDLRKKPCEQERRDACKDQEEAKRKEEEECEEGVYKKPKYGPVHKHKRPKNYQPKAGCRFDTPWTEAFKTYSAMSEGVQRSSSWTTLSEDTWTIDEGLKCSSDDACAWEPGCVEGPCKLDFLRKKKQAKKWRAKIPKFPFDPKCPKYKKPRMADPACDKKKWKIIKDCPEDCPTQKGCNLLGVTSMVANLVSKPSPGVLLETKRNYTYPGKDGAVIGRDKKEECPDVQKGTVGLTKKKKRCPPKPPKSRVCPEDLLKKKKGFKWHPRTKGPTDCPDKC